jgi:hypothetical protein
MADVHIDKLALKLSGMKGNDGKLLAEKLGAALGTLCAQNDLPERREMVRVRMQPAQGAGPDQVAELTVRELMRELRRS